jgi:hypothetical protein
MGQAMGNLKNSMPGGTDVADPGQSWGNMDASQRGVSVLGGAAKGLGQGMQNYQQQNSAMRQRGGGQGLMPMAPSDSGAPTFSTENLPGGGAPRPRNPLFYGMGS